MSQSKSQSQSNDASPSTIVVIGAGVIGLSSAIKLQQALPSSPLTRRTTILLVSREWPTSIPGAPITHTADYASMWAGAHVRPIPASTPQLQREANWLKYTVSEFAQQLKKEPGVGIRQVPGVEYLDNPPREYEEQDAESFAFETGLPGYRKMSREELPDGVRLGYEYETFCINAPLYCGNLLRRFIVMGGRTVQRDLKSEWEAYSLAPNVKLVINASGNGFGDPKCYPIRGQTVLTNLTSAIKTVTRQSSDGSWSFIIPRPSHGGTIIGGTKEPHDWRLDPSPDTRHRLLTTAQSIIPLSLSPVQKHDGELDFAIIKDIVGRRPARDGGMRVEVEAKGDRYVVHAYGAAGRGFEVSWGVAAEVAELARNLPPFVSAEGAAAASKL